MTTEQTTEFTAIITNGTPTGIYGHTITDLTQAERDYINTLPNGTHITVHRTIQVTPTTTLTNDEP